MTDRASPWAELLAERFDVQEDGQAEAQQAGGDGRPRIGRPPMEYTPEVGARICEMISAGMSLFRVCKMDGMPSSATVYKWLEMPQLKLFAANYTRAQVERSARIAEDAIDIADEEPDAQRARVRVDTRKWFAARMDPKRWGDRQILAGDKDAPLMDPLSAVLQAVAGKTRGLPSEDEA